MIVGGKRGFPGAFFLFRGSALEQIWPWLLASAVISVVLTYELEQEWQWLDLTITPFSLVGLALSIFLGFRNSACYDRWWEARKLWGRLINVSRVLARQCDTLMQGGEKQASVKRRVMLMHAAYAHVLRQALRNEDAIDEYRELLQNEDIEAIKDGRNRPSLLHHRIGKEVRKAYDAGLIESYHLPNFDNSLTEIANIQGACERIKKTPVPMSYTELIHRIVAIYVLALPFGIVHTVGDLTPIVVVIIAFCFLGLDAVGSQIEDPFDLDPNDLPLSAISRMIENDVYELLGEEPKNPELKPVNGIIH